VKQQPTISFYVPEIIPILERLSVLEHEECNFISLDHTLQSTTSISVTSKDPTQVSLNARSILLSILDSTTTSIIIMHNHPSGKAHPSKADYVSTNQLITLGELLQFKVLDHIIVTSTEYFSFAEQGILESIKNQCA
jgi:DNA repair protein RadC